MKILYRILVILLWIPVLVNVAIGLPICFLISPFVFLFTGKTKGLFFEMYLMLLDKMIDILEYYIKKGE
jgi:hypothetical protein